MERNTEFGKQATDIVTGFTGMITGHCSYITGCDQYLLTPKCDEPHKKPEGHWFDENRVRIEEGESQIQLVVEDEVNSKGPDKVAPTK